MNKTLSRVEGRDLIIERIFDAPRELVFKVFSESEHLAKWWGPRGWETTNYKLDFSENGIWHFCMRSKEGHESWGKATYKKINEPERIVYVDSFSDQHGNTIDTMPEMLVTLTFLALEDKTNLICRTQFVSEEALQKILDMGVVAGLTESWDCLDEHLQSIK